MKAKSRYRVATLGQQKPIRKKRKRPYNPLERHNSHERQRHLDAFEYYYALGDNRSLSEVAAKFNVSHFTTKSWSRNFNWTMRVEQRDIEINRQLAKKLVNSIVKAKADYRKDVQLAYATIRHTYASTIKKMQAGEELQVKDVGDLNKLITAMDKLVRLDLTLLGEDKGDLTELPQTFAEFAAALTEKWKQEKKNYLTATETVRTVVIASIYLVSEIIAPVIKQLHRPFLRRLAVG